MPNFIRIIFLLFISLSSYGQMTDAALSSQLSNLVPNNTSRLITPANVRKVIQDGYNSKISLYGSSNILGKLTYGTLYPITGNGDLVHKKYVDDAIAAIPSSSSGTVTSVTSGSLSPLFSTSVATNTTTPAFSFTPISQAANRLYAGPISGIDATPTFRVLVEADIPTLSDSKITSAATWNAKLGGSGTLNQIPYFSASNTLTSSNKLTTSGGLDFPYFFFQGTNSPSFQVYSTSSDNTGNSNITNTVNGTSTIEFNSFGSSATGSIYGSFPKANNQEIKASGDLVLLANLGSGTVVLNDGVALISDAFVHSTVPVKIDNLAGTGDRVVVANSTGVLSTGRATRLIDSDFTEFTNTISATQTIGEYDMYPTDMPVTKDVIKGTFNGKFAANSNSKTLTLAVFANNVATVTSTASNTNWICEFEMIKTGTNSVRVITKIFTTDIVMPPTIVDLTGTLAVGLYSIAIRSTAAVGDVTFSMGSLILSPTP